MGYDNPLGPHYYYVSSYEGTLAECQRVCIRDYSTCIAVDYKDAKCTIFSVYEYRRNRLIENAGSVHSVLKGCKHVDKLVTG